MDYLSTIDENSNYSFIKEQLEKIFASRCKPISEKSLKIWATEILKNKFSNDAISKAIDEFLDSDDYTLSLPSIKNLIKNFEKSINRRVYSDINCVYCGGTGVATITLTFNEEGKLINTQEYALKCRCSKLNNGILPMYDNEQTYNKTFGKNKYFRVFTNIFEKEKYLDKVLKNNGRDILC